MKISQSNQVAALCIALIASACSSGDASVERPVAIASPAGSPNGSFTPPPSIAQKQKGAPTITDGAGRTWILSRKHDSFSRGPGQSAAQNLGGLSLAGLRALSDSEVAALFSPVMLVDEYEYRLSQPDSNVGRAMRVLDSRRRGSIAEDSETKQLQRAALAGAGNEFHGGADPQPAVPSDTRVVVGPDARTFVTPTNAALPPASTAILLDDTVDLHDSDCTAALIGKGSALTAAHCLWNQQTANWVSTRTWGSGRVSRFKVSFSGGTITEKTIKYGPVTGCYSVYLPYQYTLGYTDPIYDFAIMDFRSSACGGDYQPGLYQGFAPPLAASDDDITYTAATLSGYDSTLPSQSPYATWTYFVPTLVTRSTPIGGVQASGGGVMLLHQLDTESGASGAGILQAVHANTGDPTVYTTAVHTGSGGSYNTARRFDTLVELYWSYTVDYQSR